MNTCHTSFSYITWAYGGHILSKWSSRTSDQFIWLVSEKKTEAVNAYLIKNSKGEGEGVGGKKEKKQKKKQQQQQQNGGAGVSEGSRKEWAELYGCIKQVWNDQSLRGVPGEIKRSRDLRGGRWSWTLTFAQKRSWVGRWSWAEQVGRLLLRVVQVVHQQRCNGHCLSDSVQHSSWKSNCSVHKSLSNGEGTPP